LTSFLTGLNGVAVDANVMGISIQNCHAGLRLTVQRGELKVQRAKGREGTRVGRLEDKGKRGKVVSVAQEAPGGEKKLGKRGLRDSALKSPMGGGESDDVVYRDELTGGNGPGKRGRSTCYW